VHKSKQKNDFSRKYRLGSKKEIDQLFKTGGFKSFSFLKYRYLPNDFGFTRVVISISKRVGKAPVRNRLKRLIRESLRLSNHLQDTSVDCGIFITKPLRKKPSLAEVQTLIGQFFNRLPNELKK